MVDWTQDYIRVPTRHPCTTGYTTPDLSALTNGRWTFCSARGIGINNNGQSCCIRMNESGFGLGIGAQTNGRACICEYNTAQGLPRVAVSMGDVPPTRRNVLFVCSRNQWRSPTAEQLFRRHPALALRSAGTSLAARRRAGIDDLRWADVVLVMESKHATRRRTDFGQWLGDVPIHVLQASDEYRSMDPERVEILRAAVTTALRLD